MTCPHLWALQAIARAWLLGRMFLGKALSFDPARRRCDLAFNGQDFVLDTTPMTPVLISLGCDRRAHPDDTLPNAVTNDYAPSRLNARRGWPGDALDALGRLIGSRGWLVLRLKQNEATRKLKESTVTEALAWMPLPVSVTVRWVRRGVLGTVIKVGTTTLRLLDPVGG
jgi:phage gp46-like protein